MLKKIAFTMYPVTNMERARNFYEKILGLKPGAIFGEGAWVEYDLPAGGCLAITTSAEGVTPSSTAGGSVAFEVEDLDTLVAKLKSDQVTFKCEILPFPNCRIAIILDSEGNAVTLHQSNKR